jgi:hypothetical protein
MLALFSYKRHLRVDSNHRVVQLNVRRYWFFSSEETLSFGRIRSIAYSYSALTTEFGLSLRGFAFSDNLNRLPVGLIVEGRTEPLELFTFSGEGSDVTALAGAILDEDLFDNDLLDIQGDQETSSHDFVVLLRNLLGVPIRTGMHQRVVDAVRPSQHPCPKCERQISRTAIRCVYCGTRFLIEPGIPD